MLTLKELLALILFVHADNPSSYGGSGNIWSDLSGNANDGTISGATYDATNKVFVLTGNDKIDFPAVLSAGDDTYTIEAYFKATSRRTQVVVEQKHLVQYIVAEHLCYFYPMGKEALTVRVTIGIM